MQKKKSSQFRRRIERTKNKHSRAIYKNDTIIIRLAKGLNPTEERQHIEWLYRNMTQHLLEEKRTKILINPFVSLLNGAQKTIVTLATGKRYLFTLYPGEKTKVEKTYFGFKIYVGPKTKRHALHKVLWQTLSEAEKHRIANLVLNINEETIQTRINRVKLNFANSQWGSCNSKGIIMLNTALLFVPPSALKYVIVHELSHRKQCNHSPAFWRHVEENMPTYKKAKQILLTYKLPNI